MKYETVFRRRLYFAVDKTARLRGGARDVEKLQVDPSNAMRKRDRPSWTAGVAGKRVPLLSSPKDDCSLH
jgi:hypothetical protein